MAKYLLKWYVTEPTYKDYNKYFINKINYTYWYQMHKFDENGISFILIDLSNNEIIKQKDPLRVYVADVTLPQNVCGTL